MAVGLGEGLSLCRRVGRHNGDVTLPRCPWLPRWQN